MKEEPRSLELTSYLLVRLNQSSRMLPDSLDEALEREGSRGVEVGRHGVVLGAHGRLAALQGAVHAGLHGRLRPNRLCLC